MSVKHAPTVQRYSRQRDQLVAMLENLREFVGTMPSPDDSQSIHGVDYGYTGDVGQIHELVKRASDVADAMTK